MAGNKQQFTLQFNADTTQAKKAVSDLMSSLKDVTKHNSLSLNINADLIKGAEAAQELETHLRSAVNVNTGQLNLVAFNKSLQQSGQSLSTLVTNLANAGSTGQQAFINLATAISQTQVPLRQTNALINNMMTTLKNTVKWELSSSVVHGLEGALSGAVSYVKDLNSSLTDIRIVTGQSVEDMSKFAEQANRAAKELSTTTKAYADASLIYYQQGDSQEQVAKKAALTIKAANASFNTSAAEMSEYLTAVWNSYQVGADELERYVDIMAALGAKTATSLEEIATSMQKVAATANTVGVSMEQVSSIIATVSSVTRESAESIGTSYKTIFARMGDLKLGKTLEDGVGLGQVSKQLDSIGISILDASGDLREMGDIITDLGEKWQTMSSAEKTATAQVVAGKRQYTQLMALFENWDMYQENMGIAENSEGSLEKMAKTYAESWEAASNRVKASMETIYSALINDQAMIKMTNVIAEITNGIGSFIKTLGGAKGVLTTVSAILLKMFSGNIVSGVANMTNSIVNLIKGPAKQYATILADTNKVLGDTADGTNKASIQSTSQLIALKQSLLEKEQYLTSAQQATMQAGLDAYAGQIAKLRELETIYDDISVDLDGLAAKLGKFGGAQLDGLLQHLTTVADRWSLLTDSSFTPSSNKAGAFTTQVAKNWTKASVTEGVADNAQDMVSEQMLEDLSTATQKTEQFKRALEQLKQVTEGTKLSKLFEKFDPAKLASGEQSITDLRNAISQLSNAAEADATALRRALENALNDPTLGDELANSLKEIKQALSSGQIDASEAFARLQQLFADTESKAEGLKNKLASLPTTLQKVTQSSAQIASGLMSAVSAGTALSNAIRITGNESATTAEKVGSIVSATSMGLMGIVSMTQAVQGLAVAFGVAQAKAGWIGLIGAGIAAIVTGIMAAVNSAEEKAKKAQEELDKKIADSTEETARHTEENNELKALIKEYNTLLERQRAGEDVQSELAISAQKLATAYQITGAAVAALRGEYDSFNASLRESLNYSSEYANTLRDKADAAGSTLESVDLKFGNNAAPEAYTAAQRAQLASVQRDDGWYNVSDVIEILGEEYVNKYVLPALDSHNGWEFGDDRTYKIDEGIISYIPSRAGTAYLKADGRTGQAGSVYIGSGQTEYSSSEIASDEAVVNSKYADRVSANGYLIWDNDWSADEMVEAYQDYDAWMQELLIKETEGTITDVEKLILQSLKKIVNNSTLSNAVRDYTAKLDLSQNYDLFAGVIDQIIGVGEDTLDFSNDLGTDFIGLYQEVEQYIDNNRDSFETLKGLEFGSEEYIEARTRLVNQMFNDYSSLDDYTAIYTALVESFTNQDDLNKAIQFIQDKGIKDASEINGALLTAMQMALDKGVTDLTQDATVNSIYQASKAQTKASQSRTDYQKMLAGAETFSDDMSLDEASQFYDTYWNAGIENIMAWEDFLLLDYEERKAYIDSLTENYLKTARADAEEAKRLAEDAHSDWETSFNSLYGEENSQERAQWDSHSSHYADFESSVMSNYTQDENGTYVYSGPEGKENTGYTYLLNHQGVTGAYNQYYKDQTGTNENASELGFDPEAIADYNEQAALGVQLTGELDEATSNVAGFELIADGAESATKSMSKLVNAIQQLPTDEKELRKIADALFDGDIEALINSTEAERAAIVAGMDKPVLQQSGRTEYSDVWEYLDAHPELEGQEGFQIAKAMWQEGDVYSTDQDYADYAEQTRLYQEANALNAQYIEQGIRDGAIETLATIEELSSALSSIDISNLPEQGTKAYEQLQRALAKVNISMADFMAMNDSSKYAAIAKAQNKLIDEEIAVNKQLQDHYASIMNDTSGKYDEATRMEATQNYYDAVTEGNNLVLQQEQNIANARAQAAEVYAQQAEMAKARAEEAKKEAEELKTVAETMAEAIETGQLSNTDKNILSQAGYLDDWNNAATAAERAALASKVWSEYAAETARAGEELSASYNKTSQALNGISKGYKAWKDDQSDIKGKDGEMLDLQNKDDYLQYLRDYTNMTEEQLGHISEAWGNLEAQGIDLSTKTNAEITELLAQELIDMGVDVDQAWQEAAANAKDAIKDIGTSMAQDHIEAAQTAADAWLNAFEQIAEARKILLSGGSLLEQIAGDPAKILQYSKSSGLTPQQVTDQIISGALTADQLNYSSPTDYIDTQMAQYGLDLTSQYGSKIGDNRYSDIQALGYKDSRKGWVDSEGNLVSVDLINGQLKEYYSAILQATGITKDQADQQAQEIIDGKRSYSELTSARDGLTEAIHASAMAQEMWTRQQEAETAVSAVELEDQKATVNGKSATQSELTDLQGAIERAQQAKYANKGWDSLSSADQELLSSFGISFDNVDSAAESCANALLACAEAALTLAKQAANDQGYYENAEGNYEQAMTEDEYVAAYGSTFEGGEEAARAHYQGLAGAEGAEFTTNAAGEQLLFIGNESEAITSSIQGAEDAVNSFRTSAEEVPENTMQRMAESVGMTRDEFEQFTQAMIDAGEITAETTEGQYEQARSLARIQKGLKTARDSMANWKKSLKETQGDAIAHNKVLGEMRGSFEEMLDMPIGSLNDLPEAFMTSAETADLLKGAMEGDIDSYNKLQAAVAEQILIGEGATVSPDVQSAIATISTEMDKLPVNEPIVFGELATVSPALYEALNTYLSAVAQAGGDVQAAAAALGFDVQTVTHTFPYTVSGPQYSPGSTYTDPNTGQQYRSINTSINEAEGTIDVTAIEVITNKGTHGGNIGGSTPKGKGGGGGGGGGSKPKKLDKKKPEDHKERYHETNQTLDRLADELEKVDKLKSRAYGKGHLDAIKQEISLLKQEIGLQQDYIKQAQAYLKIDRNRVASLGATFNADGTISNYDQLIDSIVAKYNAFIDKYNAADADAQENMEEEKEKMDEWFDEAMEWISQYEDTLNIIRDKENEILELQNEISAKTLEGIQYKVEFEVELNQEEVDFLDYLNEKYGEVLEKQDILVENLIKQQQLAQENLGYLNNAKAELDAKFASGELNQADYVAGLQDINDQILENLSTLEELRKEIQEAYGNALEMATEAITNHTEKMEHASQVMQSYISIMGLIGKGVDYDKLSDYYDKQYNYNLKSLETQQQYLEVLKEEESYYLAKMAAGDLTETERIQFEALQDTIAEVEDGILSKTEETLSALREAFAIAVEGILRDFEESVAGSGNTLEDLAADYEYYLEVQERHVSTSKELYEISKLNRQIEQDIAESSSALYKQRLAALQEEIKAKSADRALTEYDIQMMNLEYELLQRQMALEEAKNAKDTVRLTRDSSGNMVYQYTADQDKIAEAQQGVEDVLQQMAEANAERVTQLEQETINTYQNMVSQIEEIANSEVLTQEEKNAKIAEIVAQAQEKMLWLQDQYGIATENTMATNALIQDHYNTDMITNAQISSEAMNETIAAIINKSSELSDGMATMQEQIGQEMAELEYDINTVLNTTAWDDAGVKISTYDQVVDDATGEVEDMISALSGEDGLLDSIKDTTAAWDAQSAAIDALIDYYEDLYTAITQAQNAQANAPSTTPGTPSTSDPGTGGEEPEEGEEPVDDSKVQYQGGTWKFYTYGKASGGSAGAVFHGAGKSPVVTKEDESDKRIKISGEDGDGHSFSGRWISKTYKGKNLWKAFETGGLVDYTGPAWVDGTKENPELMLNATDTQNMLAAVQTVRALDGATLSMLDEFIKLATSSMLSADNLHASGVASTDTELQQQVQITAEFPNVQDSNEIQDAFDNLINRAAQYIGSKK